MCYIGISSYSGNSPKSMHNRNDPDDKGCATPKMDGDTKNCPKCLSRKPRSEFWNNRTTSDGLATYCKPCGKQGGRQNYIKFRDKRLAAENAKYVIDGKERKRRWREKNPDRSRELIRLSYQRHKAKRQQESRAKYHENPEPYKERALKWGKDNPLKRSLLMAQQNAKRKAKAIKNGWEKITLKQWRQILDRCEGKCIYCGKEATSVDHFQPISKGGGHVIGNIVPACMHCNVSKWNHKPAEWIERHCEAGKYAEIIAFMSESK